MKKTSLLLLAIAVIFSSCANLGVSQETHQIAMNLVEQQQMKIDELESRMEDLERQLQEAQAVNERSSEADSSDDHDNSATSSSVSGMIYMQEGNVIGEDTCPRFILNDNEGTFEFRVNLLEGMGNILGDFYFEDEKLIMDVKQRDFGGFTGDDIDRFEFAMDGESLVYAIEEYIGETKMGSRFIYWGQS